MAPLDVKSTNKDVDRDPVAELERLRAEYADRESRLRGKSTYSLSNPGQLFMVRSRQLEVLKVLARERFGTLENKDILEIGCGDGRILQDFVPLGAEPGRLYGVELLDAPLEKAKRLSPNLQWTKADAQALPFPNGRFDLVTQFTVFTSILDDQVKCAIALEMLRVLRRDGLILWYDFWWNPTNPQTRGIRAGEIRSLFPNCECSFRRVTLAPPISRLLAKYSWSACQFLESLRVLCSHYLVAIRPKKHSK
jgi:ubiquinone/menaquinone biosynthesis C-methylase UbiE